MNKEESLKFIKSLEKNEFLSKEYREKFKELSIFIENNVPESGAKKLPKPKERITEPLLKVREKLSLVKNPEFEDGETYDIYTDGGCLVNPGGVGGYGVIILGKDGETCLSKGFKSTTNNRMELMGPIDALKSIPKGSNVTIYSDSKYFCDSINLWWLESWLGNDWKHGSVKNIDLWTEFVKLYNLHHVTVKWVKGHASNVYNNRCDEMATKAYSGDNLYDDI